MPTTEAKTTSNNTVADVVARLVAESEAEGGYTSSGKAARLCGSNNPSTFSRHCTRGIWTADGRRVVLESIIIGGKRLTTRSAITRFLEAQQSGQSAPTPPAPRSPAARRKASDSASARADALLA